MGEAVLPPGNRPSRPPRLRAGRRTEESSEDGRRPPGTTLPGHLLLGALRRTPRADLCLQPRQHLPERRLLPKAASAEKPPAGAVLGGRPSQPCPTCPGPKDGRFSPARLSPYCSPPPAPEAAGPGARLEEGAHPTARLCPATEGAKAAFTQPTPRTVRCQPLAHSWRPSPTPPAWPPPFFWPWREGQPRGMESEEQSCPSCPDRSQLQSCGDFGQRFGAANGKAPPSEGKGSSVS